MAVNINSLSGPLNKTQKFMASFLKKALVFKYYSRKMRKNIKKEKNLER